MYVFSGFFWILSNFIVCWFRVGNTLIFEPNFQHDWKFLDFAKFHPSHVQSGRVSQISNIAKARIKISGFCQISSMVCPEWSKLSILGLIFIRIENFWILPTFIFRMSWMVKNVSFELNFWQESKFHHWQFRGGQTLDFKSNLQRDWKYLDFAKFHPPQVWSGQKSHFWARFSMQLKILPNFYLCMSRVVKTINFGLNFYCDWKFLNFTKFRPSHILSGQKCMFFLDFSGFCQILSFAGSEWATLSFLSQIFNTTENFWILPNFILRMSRVVEF